MRPIGNVFILALIILISCQKESHKNNFAYNVDEFVQMVIVGEYNSLSLPKLSSNDIPSLLEYANDFQEIPYFPRNPLSSYMPPKFRLGECLLWTIESIKLSYDKEPMQYPSNNPMLIKNDFEYDPAQSVLNDQELLIVYDLYQDWWKSNEGKLFEEFRDINVLESSGFHWF